MSNTLGDFSLRPARPEDADAVAALSAHIWEGEDYVPRRFAEWTADAHGQFTLAWEGDQLIGFGKLTRLRRGQWWLEGLRVHPQHRGRGIARLLHEHAVQLADEIAQGVLRFATADENVAVHRLATDTGFQMVARFCLAEAPAATTKDAGGRLVAVADDELEEVRAWLPASAAYQAWGGLYEARWKWIELLPEVERLCQQDRLFWWQDEARPGKGLLSVQSEDEEVLWLNYIGADASLLQHVGQDLRALAAGLGRQRVRAKPPSTPEFRRALEASGWQIEADFEMCVFERRLAQ